MNCTDLNPGEPRVLGASSDDVVRLLSGVAYELTQTRPTHELGSDALLVEIGLKAYEVGGSRRAACLSVASRTVAPRLVGHVTRGEYALWLSRLVGKAAYEWSEEDNKPVIPRIPGPRKPLGGGR